MSQVALLRTYFTNSRDLLAFKMDPEIFSSGTYYRRMQTRTLIWETDASVLQMLQIAIFLQARARSQPVDRADAWFQLQSLKVIGTVPKKMTEGFVLLFSAPELMSFRPGGASGGYFVALMHEISFQRFIVIE